MKDEEVNKLANDPNELFMIQYRKIEAERDGHYVTANFDQAKIFAKKWATDQSYKSVKLHRIVIKQTWTPVATVEFQSEEEDNASST